MEEWSGSTVQIQLTRCRGESDGEKLDDGGIIGSRRGHGKDRRWVGQAKRIDRPRLVSSLKGSAWEGCSRRHAIAKDINPTAGKFNKAILELIRSLG